MNTFILKIYRGAPGEQYWEEFEIERRPFLNIISALMDIQRHPKNRKQESVAPVVYEAGCLEEVCGSCSMLINGKPRQACTALVDHLLEASGSNVITLAPMTKFPLVRDLCVNRDSMFENLKKVHAWIDAEDSYDRGFGPRIAPKLQETMYVLSTCMTCGCCTEACPQVNANSTFMGPAPISQVRLFNAHPIGELTAEERTHALMGEGGVSECGNAQNCVAICPKEIPLTESLAVMGGKVAKQAIRDLFSLPDAHKS
jgi:succinate dehydrogenase / fumarate reductase, iron-sulfur subunit